MADCQVFSLKSNTKHTQDLPLTSPPPGALSLPFSIILSASSKESTLVSSFHFTFTLSATLCRGEGGEQLSFDSADGPGGV